MNIPKELIEQWVAECNRMDMDAITEYIAQRAAEWAVSQSVSMEPVAEVESDGVLRFKKIDRRYQVGDKLYLESQLAQARQQGAEITERTAKVLLEQKSQRIADLEKSNVQLLEALKAMLSVETQFDAALAESIARAAIASAEVKP